MLSYLIRCSTSHTHVGRLIFDGSVRVAVKSVCEPDIHWDSIRFHDQKGKGSILASTTLHVRGAQNSRLHMLAKAAFDTLQDVACDGVSQRVRR